MANKSAELLIKIKEAGSEILDRLVITFDDIISVVGQIPQAIGRAIDAFREQEQAVNQLNQSMINQGVYSAELQNKYLDLAGALQKVTLFSDDQINSAQALLQSHIGSKEVTESLLRATLNLAAAKKMDLASAADLVGKAISSENDILSRHGVHIDAVAAKTDKMGAVIDGLNQKFGGQAEAAAKGTGSTLQLHKAFGELVETIGERLSPAVNTLSSGLAALFYKIAEWGSSNSLAAKSVAEIDTAIEKLQKKLETLQARSMSPMGAAGIERTEAEISQTEAKIAQLTALRDKQHAAELASEEAQGTALAEQRLKNRQTIATEESVKLEAAMAQQEFELAMAQAKEEEKLGVVVSFLDKQIKATEDVFEKRRLMQQKYAVLEAQTDMAAKQSAIERQKKIDEETVKNRTSTLNTIASLQGESNQTLAAIGKAAALTQIAIETPVAIGRALAAFPPPINFVAAGAVGAAMGAQAARVSGIALAEGGIVLPRPGGIQATIGEGGQAEAVIPLDRAGEFGMGGGLTVNITVNGGMLGDESTAYEFVKAIDKGMLKLRQNNESVSFDSGVI